MQGVSYSVPVLPCNRGNLLLRLGLPKEFDQPSQKFDNKIGGVTWIDDLKLEPVAGILQICPGYRAEGSIETMALSTGNPALRFCKTFYSAPGVVLYPPTTLGLLHLLKPGAVPFSPIPLF